MATSVQIESSLLQSELFDNLYYLDEYMRALSRARMSTASIDQYEFSDLKLLLMWADFRTRLPDLKEIQRAPFQRLTKLLECLEKSTG